MKNNDIPTQYKALIVLYLMITLLTMDDIVNFLVGTEVNLFNDIVFSMGIVGTIYLIYLYKKRGKEGIKNIILIKYAIILLLLNLIITVIIIFLTIKENIRLYMIIWGSMDCLILTLCIFYYYIKINKNENKASTEVEASNTNLGS